MAFSNEHLTNYTLASHLKGSCFSLNMITASASHCHWYGTSEDLRTCDKDSGNSSITQKLAATYKKERHIGHIVMVQQCEPASHLAVGWS